MLPTAPDAALSLTDVLPSSLAAMTGGRSRIRLPRARSVIVVLVDGLGADALRANAGHARFLSASPEILLSATPSTTAASLASLTTGLPSGQHGLVGYSALDAQHDRVVNLLTGWDERMDPLLWQPHPTVFETAAAAGIRSAALGPSAHAGSGLSTAILRGAEYEGIDDSRARAERAVAIAQAAPALVYLYLRELDMTGHRYGWKSDAWLTVLEEVDATLAATVGRVGSGVGVLVTGDHGMADVAYDDHVLFDRIPGLLDGVRHVGGEPRFLHLYAEPDLETADRAALAARWKAAEGARAWVATRDEAVASGRFGQVDPNVLPRIGDIVVAAQGPHAYYDGSAGEPAGRKMIGQHGSLTAAETRVPLRRAGIFAR